MKARLTSRVLLVCLLTSVVLFLIWRHDRNITMGWQHCIWTNASFIKSDKEQWAMSYRATNGTAVTTSDLRSNNGGNDYVCTRGGSIRVGSIGKSPTCTVHGDLLDNPRKESTLLFYK